MSGVGELIKSDERSFGRNLVNDQNNRIILFWKKKLVYLNKYLGFTFNFIKFTWYCTPATNSPMK